MKMLVKFKQIIRANPGTTLVIQAILVFMNGPVPFLVTIVETVVILVVPYLFLF